MVQGKLGESQYIDMVRKLLCLDDSKMPDQQSQHFSRIVEEDSEPGDAKRKEKGVSLLS